MSRSKLNKMQVFLFKCRCDSKEFAQRLAYPTTRGCRVCGGMIPAATSIDRRLRNELQNATWQHVDSTGLANVFSEMGFNVQEVENDVRTRLRNILEKPRVALGVHRNVGSILGRPGLSSSSLKSLAAFRNAVSASDSRVVVKMRRDSRHPSVLGQLVEKELAMRNEAEGDDEILSSRKPVSTPRILHPALDGFPVSVSTDGLVHCSSPFEEKTVSAQFFDSYPRRDFLTGVVHQLAQQAIVQGVDEGVLLFVERQLDGTGRYTALKLSGIVGWHIDRVSTWLRNPAVAAAFELFKAGVSSE